MKKGDIVELIEDMTFYKKGRKAYFIRLAQNPNNAEIVWFGEEKTFNEFGDVEEVPLNIIRLCS